MTCNNGIFPLITSNITDFLAHSDILNYGQKYHCNCISCVFCIKNQCRKLGGVTMNGEV